MKIGDLVKICPGDPTTGIYVGPDPETEYLSARPFVEIEGIVRSMVLFDADVYSVPTFQLEVVDESR